MKKSDSFGLMKGWKNFYLYLMGVFFAVHLTHGQYASVSQTSNPVGFLDQSETYEVGTRFQSVLPELTKDGYVFGYWTVNGWRYGDLTGRAVTQPSFLVEETLNLVAHYFEENLDSDGDGLDDWYEYRNFGTLDQSLSDDSDNDGYSNGKELMMGQQSTVVDAVDDGGISSRDSSSFVYGSTSLLPVKISSQPTGFVEGTLLYLEENASYQSQILNGESYGHTFSYWTVNDVRQVGLTGVASSDARVSVSTETEVVAHYYPTDEDSDSDGIPDWFEYNQFGDLSQSQEDDADGDSFDNGQENFLGQEAMIRDLVVDGGISSRDSSMFVFGDSGLAQYSLASNPVGFVDGEVAYGQPGDEISTGQQYGEKFGYRFVYWTVNGERQAGPTGLALSSVHRSLSDGDELVAHYIPEDQDSDEDGIPDWFELNQFGDLSQGPEDDPDQDLYANQVEVQQGNEALIRDLVMDGGISSRDSSTIAYYIQANRLPAGIVLEPNYFYKESPVGELVGDLQTLDYDDPDGTDSYTYELVSGLGDLDNDKFSITGDQVFTAVELGLGQYYIRVRVTDGEGGTYSQSLLINGVSDPQSDNDSDGLTFEEEQSIGSDPEVFDTDEDGLSDGFEYANGLNPLTSENAIVITRPFDREQVERNSTLEVAISLESQLSQGSLPRWVYKFNESFASSESLGYEALDLSVNDWLDSLRDGNHTVYVGLLDPAGGDAVVAEDSVIFELVGGDIVPFYYLTNEFVELDEPTNTIEVTSPEWGLDVFEGSALDITVSCTYGDIDAVQNDVFWYWKINEDFSNGISNANLVEGSSLASDLLANANLAYGEEHRIYVALADSSGALIEPLVEDFFTFDYRAIDDQPTITGSGYDSFTGTYSDRFDKSWIEIEVPFLKALPVGFTTDQIEVSYGLSYDDDYARSYSGSPVSTVFVFNDGLNFESGVIDPSELHNYLENNNFEDLEPGVHTLSVVLVYQEDWWNDNNFQVLAVDRRTFIKPIPAPIQFLTGRSDLPDGNYALLYPDYLSDLTPNAGEQINDPSIYPGVGDELEDPSIYPEGEAELEDPSIYPEYGDGTIDDPSIYPEANGYESQVEPILIVPVYQDDHGLWLADTSKALPVIRDSLEIEDYFSEHEIVPAGQLSLPPFLLNPIAHIDLSTLSDLEGLVQGYDRIFYQELSSPREWTLYDSFTQPVLDTNLWDSGYFSGGDAPSISDGKLIFAGSSSNGNDPYYIPDYLGVDEVPDGGGHSFLLLNDQDAFGVELEVTIPSDQNSQELGFFIDLFDRSIDHHELIELRWGSQGLEWSWPQVDSYGDTYYLTRSANLDQTYRVAVVLKGDFYTISVDDEEIAEVAATLLPKHWSIGVFNDNGESFSVEIDNVKVFRPINEDPQFWALSIEMEENSQNSDKPDLLVDMAGFVYEGHYADYWQQVLRVSPVYDPETSEEMPPTGWFEKSYGTDLTGLDNLYNSHPIIEQGGIEIDYVTNQNTGIQLPENTGSGLYLAQLALKPSVLPYLRSEIERVSNYQGQDLPEGDYFVLSDGHTFTSGSTSFDFEDSFLGSGINAREIQISLGIGVGFDPELYQPQMLYVNLINVVEDFDGDGIEDHEDSDQYTIFPFSDSQVELLTGQTSKGGKYFIRNHLNNETGALQLVEVDLINGKFVISGSVLNIHRRISDVSEFLSSFGRTYKEPNDPNYIVASPDESSHLFLPLPTESFVGKWDSSWDTILKGVSFNKLIDENNVTLEDLESAYPGVYALYEHTELPGSYHLDPVIGFEINGNRRFVLYKDIRKEMYYGSKQPRYTPSKLPEDARIGFFGYQNIKFLTGESMNDNVFALLKDDESGFLLSELIQVQFSDGFEFLELNSSNRILVNDQEYAAKLYEKLSNTDKAFQLMGNGLFDYQKQIFDFNSTEIAQLTGKNDLSGDTYYLFRQEDNESLESVEYANVSTIISKYIEDENGWGEEVWASSLDFHDVVQDYLDVLPPSFFLENDFNATGSNILTAFQEYNSSKSFWVNELEPDASANYVYYHSVDILEQSGDRNDSLYLLSTYMPIKSFGEISIFDRNKSVVKIITMAPRHVSDEFLKDGDFELLEQNSQSYLLLGWYVSSYHPDSLWDTITFNWEDHYGWMWELDDSDAPLPTTELTDINEISVVLTARVLNPGSQSSENYFAYGMGLSSFESYDPFYFGFEEEFDDYIPYASTTKFGFELSISPNFPSSSTTTLYVDSNDTEKLWRSSDDIIYESNYIALGDEANGTLDDEYSISINFGDELVIGTTYYVRSFLQDQIWNTGYGETISFVAKSPNDPPHSLKLNGSTILENQPAGTLVGTFTATDPEGGTLRYELIASANKNTQLFNLSTDGKLTIKRALNFETDPKKYQLVVVVTDDDGQTFSNQFEISLLNENEDLDGDGIEDHADLDDDGDGFSDQEELDYGSDPRNAKSMPNRAPVSLTLNTSEILENKPRGTVVGTFTSSDPDGDVLTFTLTTAVKELKLSEKGILTTTRVLDYETDESEYEINVVVSDDEGYEFSKDFNITLVNVTEDLDGDGVEDYFDLDDDGDGFSDKVEIAYPSDPRDPKSMPNRAPSKLNLSNDSILENEPVGTEVGIFEGFDPDGDGLNFTLTKAVVEFNLSEDGNLTLARSLDFEVDAKSYSLSVKASDGTGLAFSKTFTITLLNVVEDLDDDGVEDHLDLDDDGDGFDDEFEIANGFDPRNGSDKVYKPIVDTLDAVQKNGSSYEFRAKILADGGLQPTSYGFIKGTSLTDMSEVMYASSPVSDQQEFSLDISELVKGETYYFKAFAENAAGLSFGNVNKFTASDNNWWADAEVYEGGWRINWLGAFLPNENGWVYHLDLGWTYVQSDDLDGIWMWMDRTGWVWTSPEASPFLWSSETSDWLYPIKANGVMRFYDYSTSNLSVE